ncbi:probable Vacuolar protein sorting/targeting protein 10 [Cephalotrichum gorgonifer]|uniref:Vacuolar protein sorting/targeting protein 10 n=1 Tax=Cephalotrichum gorgonifer TaxID=2041049 RepID=A0AAE8MPB9_9PEZI|nr:probable Vacuolar protein sorting/targeting protein 10 [Cephalotrichum gorgonifer]
MRFRGRAAASWRHMLVSSLLWAGAVTAKPDTPTMSVKAFDNPPGIIQYFRGSDDVLFHDPVDKVLYSSKDAGASWNKLDQIPDGKVYMLVMHDFDNHRAYALGEQNEHYFTEDNGKTWKKFNSFAETSVFQDEILRFHAGNPDHILFNGMLCKGIFCEEVATYTADGFKTPVTEPLRYDTSGCWWAKSAPEFTTGDKELDENRVLCIVRDSISIFKEDQRLVASDTYFREVKGKDKEFEPAMESSKSILGVTNVASVTKFLLVAAAAPGTDEMALYVTTDTVKWHRAMFPLSHGHTINQGSYTVLESTNYSLQVDVMNTRPSNPMGVMFTSNSDGTYFTENLEHTNRDDRGLVDFEKITGIQGIFLLNKVANGDEIEKDVYEKKEIVSEITFDDGRTFEEVKAGDERIHLHSITEMNNIGRVFSSPAPGLVMGNGNTGKYLKDIEDADLYVSDNAGVTWKKALSGPHKYDVGDQGSVLVAVKETKKEDATEFSYSLDHGENWKQVSLPDDLSIRPIWFTTSQDSSTLQFILLGKAKEKYHMISIDFEGLQERTCKAGDMEEWHARVDSEKKSTCLMGHKQTFTRRKKDADCFVKEEFTKAVAKTEDCECSDQDFECDFNFVRNGEGECVPDGPIVDSDGACKNAKPDDTFKGSSGWRLIPGNTCKRTGGAQKDDPVERKCGDAEGGAPSKGDGSIGHEQFVFKSEYKDFQKFYLEKGDTSMGGQNDETIIVRPVKYSGDNMIPEDKIWRTTDHGKHWDRILEDEDVIAIYQHPSYNEAMFFTTKTNKVIYTVDRGAHFYSFKAPGVPVRDAFPFSFHPDKKDWMIALVDVCDDHDKCNREAHLSRNRGDKWTRIVRHAVKCEFTGSEAYKFRPVKQIVCIGTAEDDEDKGRQLFVSNDFFEEEVKHPTLEVKDSGAVAGVRNFAKMSEFIVVAAEEKDKPGLVAFSSMDGKEFAQAKFPANLKADHSREYTVLDSSTHAINIFVPTEVENGHRLGNILKSNSNGTSYVLSASGVNCDDKFYVDFDKIPGLEGVSVINTVANADKTNEAKKLQTKVTHSDGAEWFYLAPPKKDIDGKSFSCRSDKGDKSCALHLHGYTERIDKRKSYAAATAVGLMFGIGNVGPHLEGIDKADTYMTTDGGITWKQVQKGVWTWQYGDQGSLTVLVKQWRPDNKVETNHVVYSTDEGKTWNKYEFAKEDMPVYDITAQRSGSSRNFILWGGNKDGDIVSVNLDFTGLASQPCEEGDYYGWTPKNAAGEEECLFGHKSRYLRKIADKKCYNDGRVKHDRFVENCACTRSDFECAYNFELDSSGQCNLVPGLSPLTAEEWCSRHPDATEYFEPTGYRRIPLTTCSGGQALDEALSSVACAGHEEEYERKHGVSGVAIFFAVVIPFALAGAAGWYVWRNWHTKFGQIRLGESRGFEFDGDSPWVQYPVMALSAVVAVVAALPLVATSLWRAATSAYRRVGSGGGGGWLNGGAGRRYTTRDSFARSMGDYAVVDDVEGELLGDDSDEEV